MVEGAVELKNVSKRFGDVQALAGVSLSLRRGEVHVLAGENGAGKTTLMNVLAGLYQADEGETWIDERLVRIRSPKEALALGIGMVHQHFELVRPMSVLENVLLGKEGGWRLRPRQHRRDLVALLERYKLAPGLSDRLDSPVGSLAIGVQQKIEIVKALYRGVDVLILDEPTTHLTPQEVDALFGTIRGLVGDGLTVVLITHKLREIRGIGDRVSVMRRGHLVGTLEAAEATEERLVELLMGASRGQGDADRGEQSAPTEAPTLLEVRDLSADAEDDRPLLRDCSLDVRSGEIVGVAGVAGNGQPDLAEVIQGTLPAKSGSIRVKGRDLTGASVRDRLLAGIAYVPEDRMRDGILPRLSVAETLALGPHHALFRSAWAFDERRVRGLARQAIAEYGIVSPSEMAPTALLSGGNIQKVLVARAMLLAAMAAEQGGQSVVIALNPARGLDLGTTAFVHRRLLDLRERGDGVLMMSEDLDELMRLSDRILVLYRGSIVGRFGRREFDAYRIGALMVGGSAHASAAVA